MGLAAANAEHRNPPARPVRLLTIRTGSHPCRPALLNNGLPLASPGVDGGVPTNEIFVINSVVDRYLECTGAQPRSKGSPAQSEWRRTNFSRRCDIENRTSGQLSQSAGNHSYRLSGDRAYAGGERRSECYCEYRRNQNFPEIQSSFQPGAVRSGISDLRTLGNHSGGTT